MGYIRSLSSFIILRFIKCFQVNSKTNSYNTALFAAIRWLRSGVLKSLCRKWLNVELKTCLWISNLRYSFQGPFLIFSCNEQIILQNILSFDSLASSEPFFFLKKPTPNSFTHLFDFVQHFQQTFLRLSELMERFELSLKALGDGYIEVNSCWIKYFVKCNCHWKTAISYNKVI